MRTVAVLPVKRFGRAKQRLGAALTPRARRALAEAMVADVLDALTRCRLIDQLVVVTCEERVRELADQRNALVIGDREEAGQSAAARIGLGRAVLLGADRALLVPSDTPALDPAQIDALLAGERAAPRELVIVPDRHRTGTNALLISPPCAFTPSFGPDSFARHRAQAEQAGLPWRLAEPSSLVLDVDTIDDLLALRPVVGAAPASIAPATRAQLEPELRDAAYAVR